MKYLLSCSRWPLLHAYCLHVLTIFTTVWRRRGGLYHVFPTSGTCTISLQLPTTYYLLLTRAGVAGVAAVAGDGDAKVGGGALGRR